MDTYTFLVSIVVVTLPLKIGLYAGKLEYFLGPLSLKLLGIIQTFNYYKEYCFKTFMNIIKENEQSAGNRRVSYFSFASNTKTANSIFFSYIDCKSNEIISQNLHISDHLPKHTKPKTDDEFGFYLAGLIEAGGNFGDNFFEICFTNEDTSLAYFIKKQIGFGSVKKVQKTNTVKYILTHPEGLKRLLNLVNGKFLTNKIINQLLKHNFDKLNIPILPITSFDLKKNHWLTGFSDVEGKFSIKSNLKLETLEEYSQVKNQKLDFYLRLEFKIKQKSDELLKLVKANFDGNIFYSDSEQLFYYQTTDFNSAKKIIEYFDKFQLNSSKFISYIKWRKMYRVIQRNEHLTQAGLIKINKVKGYLRD